jgi:hypothetical protein
MRRCLLMLIICCTTTLQAQQNLVPNPSFEEYLECPISSGQLWSVPPWEKFGTGGVNFYHECGTSCCGIPENDLGGGQARTGEAYISIATVYNNHAMAPLFSESQFLGTTLTEPLVVGKRYRATFFLMLVDSARFAGKNVGAHFSIGRPVDVNWDANVEAAHLLSLTPQVRYEEEDFLSDKNSWMSISGSFTANGGEDYITIGNFDGYANSDTLNLNDGGVYPSIGYWEGAYYVIDDVSVIEDTAWTGISGSSATTFNLWPNPANDVIYIETNGQQNMEVQIYDMAGRQVLATQLHASKQTMRIGHLPSGKYMALLKHNGSEIIQKHLLKQ